MSILAGLGKFGLDKLEEADVFGQEAEAAKKQAEAKVQEAAPKIEELVFDRKYTCPVCDKEFMSPTLKGKQVKLVGQDSDLRPKYSPIDPLKFDVIACEKCGYAALSRYFDKITPPQAKLIKTQISASFHGLTHTLEMDYDDAIERYQLALGNAIVKRSRPSERAYICLKLAWIIRAKAEELDVDLPDYDEQINLLKSDEMELLQNALEGFVTARQTEDFPMCGMDEDTVDYIIAVTAMKFKQYDLAGKMISGILTSASANSRIKDRARDLKETLLQLKKMDE